MRSLLAPVRPLCAPSLNREHCQCPHHRPMGGGSSVSPKSLKRFGLFCGLVSIAQRAPNCHEPSGRMARHESGPLGCAPWNFYFVAVDLWLRGVCFHPWPQMRRGTWMARRANGAFWRVALQRGAIGYVDKWRHDAMVFRRVPDPRRIGSRRHSAMELAHTVCCLRGSGSRGDVLVLKWHGGVGRVSPRSPHACANSNAPRQGTLDGGVGPYGIAGHRLVFHGLP